MYDPRELLQADPYANLSSEGDEELIIEERLKEIEAQKNDLVDRLKRKKESNKWADPNFKGVQVPSSPQKKKIIENIQYNQSHIDLAKTNSDDSNGPNGNESRLKDRLEKEPSFNESVDTPSSTTTYFMEKFQKSKREEENKVQEYQEMMNSRVHTFGGLTKNKTYTPIASNEIEEYSNLWVKKRYLPNDELHKMMEDIKILRLNKLFAKVKPPKFVEPQYSNWAVIGIISKKSEIKFTASNKSQKYMKFTLTNFKYSLDTYIFGKAGVEKYYNLRVGDIVAILNPEVLPWRPSGKEQFIKSFNLRISHGFNCIVEIAQSKDLGWCPEIVKSQNKPCGTPINISTDRCCEFHREIQFRKANANRVDLTGGYALGAPVKSETQPALYRPKLTSETRNMKSSTNQYKILPSWSQQNPQFFDKYGGKSKFFSNSNAAKAFFDEKYQNPDMLTNLQNKRRKIQDTKRDRNTDKELDKILTNGKLKLDGVNDKKKVKKMKEKTQNALQSGIIQRLGFDPTHGKLATVLNYTDKNSRKNIGDGHQEYSKFHKKDNEIKALMDFKKDKVILKPSRIEILKKRKNREEIYKKTFGKHEIEIPRDEDMVGSDSDLEII